MKLLKRNYSRNFKFIISYFNFAPLVTKQVGLFSCPKGGGHPHGIQNPGHHR
nr:MAG TPA: hypothetical protein [Bacteriophage sp.]